MRLINVGLALVALGCGEELVSETCRLRPADCDGGYGGLCATADDCASGLTCCTNNGNCGAGMCTKNCNQNTDCPPQMRCEHNLCFYACASDADCSDQMSCEHGNTVCEWP